jgi:hypothetical protein
MFKAHNDSANYTRGLLLLALTIMGNFVSETLSCSTQRLLTSNRIAKHLIILFLIYFTLNITNSDEVHPYEEIKMAFILWLCFLIFTKMSVVYEAIVFTCFCLHYILDNYRDYYHKNNIHDYDNQIYFMEKLLLTIIILTTIIGFLSYIVKKNKQHKKFSWYTFFIGVDKCN